jgi:tetratricopeptide (TPR) repeat protein
MTCKRIILLCLVTILGACSSVRSLVDEAVLATKTIVSEPAVSETSEDSDALAKKTLEGKQVGSLDPKKGATSNKQAINTSLDPNIQQAQALISQSDLYYASKRKLSPSTKTRVVNALSQFNRGELAQSEEAIKEIIFNDLNVNSAVYVLAGDIALAVANTQESDQQNAQTSTAITHYQQALKLNPHNAKAANRLGVHMREIGEFDKADKLYSQAINAQPSLPESYRNRAVLYDLYLNEKAKALLDYQAYSALLDYALYIHTNTDEAYTNQAALSETFSAKPLNEKQVKSLKTNIKMVGRWLVDVGRQVDALEKTQSNHLAGGR